MLQLMGVRCTRGGGPAGLLAGYIFCCSGVFLYQYIKYQEANKLTGKHGAVKGNTRGSSSPRASEAISNSSSSLLQRSKADVIHEMQRLQDELTDLDHRIKK